MLITYLLLFVLVLLVVYFVELPISKKRPVFIRERGCAILLSTLVALGAIVNPLVYLIAILAGLLLYFAKPWVVYGVSRDQINDAIERAALATRTPCLTTSSGYKLDDNTLVKIAGFGNRLHYVQFKEPKVSKKAKLTKNVSRKFIQNYFMST